MKLSTAALIAAAALLSTSRAQGEDLTAPAVSVGGTYYQNSDNDQRYDQGLGVMVPLTHFAVTATGDSRVATDPSGTTLTQELLLGLIGEPSPKSSLQAAVGAVRFDAGTKPAGVLEGRDRGDAGQLRARFEYAPLFETAQMIRNRIMFAGFELQGKAALLPRFTPGADVFLRDYSDNNDSIKIRGDLPYAIFLSPVRWEIGYRQDYAAFRRQTQDGYFDPDQLNAFQAVSSVSYWTEELEGYAEVFGGLQNSSRSGNHSTDGFVGGYAEAALRTFDPFQIALTAEGDDYSLGSASGFRHLQIGLRLTMKV